MLLGEEIFPPHPRAAFSLDEEVYQRQSDGCRGDFPLVIIADAGSSDPPSLDLPMEACTVASGDARVSADLTSGAVGRLRLGGKG